MTFFKVYQFLSKHFPLVSQQNCFHSSFPAFFRLVLLLNLGSISLSHPSLFKTKGFETHSNSGQTGNRATQCENCVNRNAGVMYSYLHSWRDCHWVPTALLIKSQECSSARNQCPYVSMVTLINKTNLLGVPKFLALNAEMDISPPLHRRVIPIPGGNPVLCPWKQGSPNQCFIPTAGNASQHAAYMRYTYTNVHTVYSNSISTRRYSHIFRIYTYVKFC